MSFCTLESEFELINASVEMASHVRVCVAHTVRQTSGSTPHIWVEAAREEADVKKDEEEGGAEGW